MIFHTHSSNTIKKSTFNITYRKNIPGTIIDFSKVSFLRIAFDY